MTPEVVYLLFPPVHVGHFDLHARVEGLVDDLARHHVLQLGPHEGRALARLDVLEFDDIPKLSLKVQRDAVLQVVRGCQGWSPITGRAAAPIVESRRGLPRLPPRPARE